jgi:hypothetical protein
VSRVWFTDRDLGKQFPAILREAGLTVERHADLVAQDGSDEEWLAHCGRYGRVALSHNSRIRYVPNELAAVVKFKVALIIIVGQVPAAELARNVVRSQRRLRAFLAAHDPPFIAKVYRPSASELAKDSSAAGHVELWYPRR